MRTTLHIDSDLLRTLMARHQGSTEREAVERAISGYLSRDAVARTKALRGRVLIEDVSAGRRSRDRRT